MLKVIPGNATHPEGEGTHPILIPHVCNDLGKWGAGFTKGIDIRWGDGPREAYQSWAKGNPPEDISLVSNIELAYQTKFELGGLQALRLPNKIYLVNMIGQHRVASSVNTGRKPIRYIALAKAMKNLAEQVILHDTFENISIHCPKFGSGLAGGNEDAILEMIREAWIDNDIDVTVYDFEALP